ncbi:MAG: hypothetical protein AUJ98_03560 [Bacteroidetes bacterium CG2_30_33_31]|nr:MAG: hypothetical protein AUJ98_03560 [Bacteroidetes bacterium CG2_30_33_31]
MKKIVLIIAVVFGLASCKSNGDDPNEIKNQISEYKQEISKIEDKIAKLESKLSGDSTNSNSNSILVGVTKLAESEFVNYVDVTGSVESNIEALISPEINGQIEKVYVSDGDYVKKGTTLFKLKTEMTNKSIEELKTSLTLAKTIFNKQKDLWDQKIGSEMQYLQAKNNKESLERKLETINTQLNMASIRAPFDGYVEEVFQKEGEMASPGRQVLQLVNLKDLKVTADVSEAYLPNMKVGNLVSISFPTFPDLIIKAPITSIGSIINPNNRTFKIQIKIPNQSNVLKPNIISNIKLIENTYKTAFVIPSIVIKNDASKQKYIYLIKEKAGKLIATKTFIETGASYGNNSMVISGLKAGDQVIYQGYNLVKNGSNVRINKI